MATTSSASPISFQSSAAEGPFYAGMGVFAFLFSVAAFGPSIVHTQARLGPITPLVALHGIVFSAWLLLFIAQTILAGTRNLALHRRIGMWSAVLAAALVVLGYQAAVAMGRRGYDLSGDAGARSDPLAAMAFPLLDIFMFAALYLAAYLYRHPSAVHKRLMLLQSPARLCRLRLRTSPVISPFFATRDSWCRSWLGRFSPQVQSTIESSSIAYTRYRSGLRSLFSSWITCGLRLWCRAAPGTPLPPG